MKFMSDRCLKNLKIIIKFISQKYVLCKWFTKVKKNYESIWWTKINLDKSNYSLIKVKFLSYNFVKCNKTLFLHLRNSCVISGLSFLFCSKLAYRYFYWPFFSTSHFFSFFSMFNVFNFNKCFQFILHITYMPTRLNDVTVIQIVMQLCQFVL